MIKIIAAISKNGVIGNNNELIFHDKQDMKHFRDVTTGHVVIMGRKTWDSIPEAFKPLKDRDNFVLTRNADSFDPSLKGAIKVRHINEQFWNNLTAISGKHVFIIGGAQVYENMIHMADELIISEFHQTAEGDAYFPIIHPDVWELVDNQLYKNFYLKTYKRK